MVVNIRSPLSYLSWFMLFLGSIFSVSSRSWPGVWFGIELNLFSILVLIISGRKGCVEPIVKYFIVQSVGSSGVVIGFISVDNYFTSSFSLFIALGLLLKLGFFPFHSWVPIVVVKSSWTARFLILSWQKLGPIILLIIIGNRILIYFSCLIMLFIGSIGGLNQNRVRSISAYSSFVHSSWILMGLIGSFWIFVFYFLFYCFSLYILFSCSKIIGKSSLKILSVRITGAVRVLILIGIPPFMGFIIKFMVLLSYPNFFLAFCIVGSVIRIKFYVSFFLRFLIWGYQNLVLGYEYNFIYFICVSINLFSLILFYLVMSF